MALLSVATNADLPNATIAEEVAPTYTAQNLSMVRARATVFTFSVGGLGVAGLDGFVNARFTAKRDAGDADSLAIISKQLGAATGIVITTPGGSASNGVLSVAVASTDTATLPPGYTSTLVYDVTLYDAAGDSYTVAGGVLTVTPNVTQATS